MKELKLKQTVKIASNAYFHIHVPAYSIIESSKFDIRKSVQEKLRGNFCINLKNRYSFGDGYGSGFHLHEVRNMFIVITNEMERVSE